jgi:alkylhydroperoxidase family enzyme
MARLPDVDPSTDPDTADAFRRTEASRGFVSNLMRIMAHSPSGQRAHAAYGHHLRFETDLTELQRELAICATVRRVPYGWLHHGNLLRQLGMTDAQMDALQQGRVPEGLSPADSALCAFIFAFASYTGVGQEVLDELRRHFRDSQVMDMALLSCYFLGSGAMITAFEPAIEGPAEQEMELAWQRKRLGT